MLHYLVGLAEQPSKCYRAETARPAEQSERRCIDDADWLIALPACCQIAYHHLIIRITATLGRMRDGESV